MLMKFLLFIDFLFVIFLLLYNDFKYRKLGFILFFVVLFFVSASFNLNDGFDINVYYKDLDLFRKYGLINGYGLTTYKDFIIINLFFYFCSFFPNNFLSSFSAIICYGIIIYILSKVRIDDKKDKFIVIISVLVTVNYLSVINGIRNMLCFSLIALFLFLKTKKTKYFYIPLLLSFGVHSFSFIFIILLLIKEFINYKYILIILICIVLLKLFPNLFISFETIPIIGNIFMRIRLYSMNSIIVNSITLYHLILFLTNFLIFSIFKHEDNNYKYFKVIVILIPLTILLDVTVFNRLMGFSTMINLSTMPYFKYTLLNDKRIKGYVNCFFSILIIFLFSFICYASYYAI